MIFSIIILLSFSLTQISPYIEPVINFDESFKPKYINLSLDNKVDLKIDSYLNHFTIELPLSELYEFEIYIEDYPIDFNIFLIDPNTLEFNGPYSYKHINNNIIICDPINSKNIILEISGSFNNIAKSNISIIVKKFINQKINATPLGTSNHRENPTILLTGYWPPTNEMIRHFSQDINLNPDGWQGDNWEQRGYDIIAYFPTFSNPDCTSCGIGNGTLQVDYQNTSDDFWPIANNHEPIGIITFSRGYMNQSWELEYNAYNRTNWINDYNSPYLPTPNPPDESEPSFYLRNSNLPMNDIVNNINNLDIGLDSYIDVDGDPGSFVSEFMAYHGTWFRDLNLFSENNCIAAGHIHVGGYIPVETSIIAVEETVRTLINYLEEFNYTSGDVNDDGNIDILDLVVIMNYILGNTELSNTTSLAADLNEDSIINIQDIILIINMILNN
jgi:hypothetical protein